MTRLESNRTLAAKWLSLALELQRLDPAAFDRAMTATERLVKARKAVR